MATFGDVWNPGGQAQPSPLQSGNVGFRTYNSPQTLNTLSQYEAPTFSMPSTRLGTGGTVPSMAYRGSGGSSGGSAAVTGLSLAASIFGSPVLGAVIGVAGQGLLSWLGQKDADEEQKRQEKLYKEKIAEEQRQWNAEYQLALQRYGMDKAKLFADMNTNKENMKNFYDERNYTRQQGYHANIMNLVNNSPIKNKYIEAWGK